MVQISHLGTASVKIRCVLVLLHVLTRLSSYAAQRTGEWLLPHQLGSILGETTRKGEPFCTDVFKAVWGAPAGRQTK